MGLLIDEVPDKYSENEKAREYRIIYVLLFLLVVHIHGILQFINVYLNAKDRVDEGMKWGDEIEFQIVKFDHKNKTVRLSLRASEVMREVEKIIEEEHLNIDLKPEYGSYMVEATPKAPYDEFALGLNNIEENMRLRRKVISRVLDENESVMSITGFPQLGVHDYFTPIQNSGISKFSLSYSFPHECVSSFPRFDGLTENIRLRRGKKIDIQVPIFMDKNTDLEEIHKLIGVGNSYLLENEAKKNLSGAEKIEVVPDPIDGFIHMDAMGYGMGLSCLQVTFQSYNIDESRKIYDQMVVIAPYMLAMTAATPIFKGVLSNIDTRWSVISQSVDDRTPEELEGPKRIPKSRYDSVDLYIGKDIDPKLNDTEVPFDPVAYNTLIENGVDPILAKHISHLFIREALVTYKNYNEVDDKLSSEHFENIQSSNWQSVRWKPPTPNGPVQAWRVELRTMELQLTDFENAAFTVFAGLLERALLYFDLNMYIPMSLNEINMKRADCINSVNTQKFYFPRNCIPYADGRCKKFNIKECEHEADYVEMSMNEIMGGNDWFPGFIPLIQVYLSDIGLEGDTLTRIYEYLDFIRQRANGTIPTAATYIREYMMNHSDYKHDSIITNKMAYDFLKEIDALNCGFHTGKTHLPCYIQIRRLYHYDSDSSSTDSQGEIHLECSQSPCNSPVDPDRSPKYSPRLVGYVDRGGELNLDKMYKKLQCARNMYKTEPVLTPCSCLTDV